MAKIPYDYDTKRQWEGQSHTRSPLFDGVDYGYWKNHMETYLIGIDLCLWEIVEDGYTLVTTTPNPEQVKENRRLGVLDAKARNILYYGLSATEYNKVSACRTAKAVWDRLEVTYEGTTEVKEATISLLEQRHHNFKMIPGESIDSMFSRFAAIANPLKSLGAEIPVKGQVSKILLAIKGTIWAPKRAAIQESAGFSTMTFEGLMGKLKAYEEQEKQLCEGDAPIASTTTEIVKQEKGKSLAFKAYKEDHKEDSFSDSEDDSEDEIAMLARRFTKFLKFNKRKTGSAFGNKKFYKEKKDETVLRCFRCNSKKHLNADCPIYKSEMGKMKEVAKEEHYATWGESDAEMLSSDEEDSEFKNGVCFMAGTSKVNSLNIPSSFDDENNMTLDDAENAYKELLLQMKLKNKAFTKLRKDFMNTNEKIASLEHELREMTIKFMEMKDVANKTDASYMNLLSENNDALVLISELETKTSNLESLLENANEIVKPVFDTTLLEKKMLELDEANIRVSTLELKNSNLVDSLQEKDYVLLNYNIDLKMCRETVSIYEAKCERLEKEVSNQKAELKSLRNVASTSNQCENENALNEKLKMFESSNSKLRDIIKKYTTSQFSLDTMVGNLSNNVNRQCLGYVPKIQPLRPKKTNQRSFAKFTKTPSSYCDDDAKYVETHKKSLCHHCNKIGHVSFDCFAFYNPRKFMWIVKDNANNCGSNKRLPMGASIFAGASSNSQ